MYRNIIKAKNRVKNNAPKKRYLYQQDDEVLPVNNTIKKIPLKNTDFLKGYRQKNAIHTGDRESAISVSCNFDYDLIGYQPY